MFRRHKNKAQSTAEYAIVIALVVAAVIAMQVYVRRGIQARIKQATDFTQAGETADANFSFSFDNTGTNLQFEPNYTVSGRSTTQDAQRSESLLEKGGVARDEAYTRVNVTGVENITY